LRRRAARLWGSLPLDFSLSSFPLSLYLSLHIHQVLWSIKGKTGRPTEGGFRKLSYFGDFRYSEALQLHSAHKDLGAHPSLDRL
jgi:hypothetical protein